MDMKKGKTNRLIKKMNGYQKANRERFLLLAFGELTQEELILYEFLIAITDWDRNHDTFGTFEATNQEIAEMLRWKANSSVSRYKKSLLEKGFIEIIGDRMHIKDFEKWELRKTGFAKIERRNADMQRRNANTQGGDANMQGFSPQQDDYSLISYKGNVSLSSNMDVLTEEDMDEIDRALSSDKKDKPY
jgi:hypothetical protein